MPGAGVVAGLSGAVAAAGTAPFASRVVLDEEQNTSRRAASAQSFTTRTGDQLDRVRRERGEHNLRAAGSVQVDAGDRCCAGSPPGHQ